MIAIKEAEWLMYKFHKLSQTQSLRRAVEERGISKEAAARLAQEDIRGGRAKINASSSNAAVLSFES